jgi:HK97 gp10 family phage protein
MRRPLLFVTGNEELDANLRELAGPAATRISKGALSAGVKVLAAAQRAKAPVGKTGNLKADIGSRNIKGASSRGFTGKAGIGVGKKRVGTLVNRGSNFKATAGITTARHGHLVGLGTKMRTRKKVGGKFAGAQNKSTGKMPANPFIRTASQQARGAVINAMREKIRQGVAREVNKLSRKAGAGAPGIY